MRPGRAQALQGVESSMLKPLAKDIVNMDLNGFRDGFLQRVPPSHWVRLHSIQAAGGSSGACRCVRADIFFIRRTWRQ